MHRSRLLPRRNRLASSEAFGGAVRLRLTARQRIGDCGRLTVVQCVLAEAVFASPFCKVGSSRDCLLHSARQVGIMHDETVVVEGQLADEAAVASLVAKYGTSVGPT